VNDLPPGTGLFGQYWDYTTEITHIPDLNIAGANVTRVDPVINFGADQWNLPFVPLETWATLWTGWVKILNDGQYVFTLGSDDGALLEIDNVQVCGSDQLQGYTESSGPATLAKGLHVVKIRYFNNRGPGLCRLFWVTPAGGDPAIVPQDCLYPASGPAPVPMPTVTSALPQGASRGQTITITGSGFADIPGLDIVTFGPNNIPAVVSNATTTALTVVIPNGVDQGPISLSVGGLTAPSVPYTVGGVFGLLARTWRDTSGNDVLTYASATNPATPDDEQVVGPLDIESLAAFNFTFPVERFRTCFTGQIWAQNAGLHGFGVASDDGSQLLVDGTLLIQNGGLHGSVQVNGQTQLAQGWHDIEVDFFQNLGGANVTLYHSDPGGGLIVCPRGYLVPPLAVQQQIPPSITNLNPNPVAPLQRLLIAGAGLTGPGGENPLVTLGGTPLVVDAASPGSVAVEIPVGVDSGPLVVRAGPLSTPPSQLTITGYGLKGEYWNIGHALSVLPSFTTPPTMTRTDGPIDFQENAAFNLPWATNPDYYAARWTGTLYAAAAGSYQLATGSDDGSRLLIDGQTVVDNDGLHGYNVVTESVNLTQGSHALELDFFENEGASSCRLLWNPPGGGGLVVVPRSSLVPP
jgi:hypothetical protein